METSSEKWIAVVYDGTEKIGSKIFQMSEDAAEASAAKWAKEVYNRTDLTLHRIING